MSYRIESLKTTDGYLVDCPVDFSRGLTCIIGSRGTCKSTIVETMRFVFDADKQQVSVLTSRDPENTVPRAGLIVATLAGGTAFCTLHDDDSGDHVVVERSLTSGPRASKDEVQQVEPSHLLDNIEIYSQSDLIKVAEDAALRLALIDRPFRSEKKQLTEERSKHLMEVAEIGARMLIRRREIESRRAAVGQLAEYRRNLEEMELSRPALPTELAAERDAHAQRGRIYEQITTTVRKLSSLPSAEDIQENIGQISAAIEAALSSTTLEGEQLAIRLHTIADALGKLLPIITANSPQVLSSESARLGAAFQLQSARYYDLMKSQEKANASLRREESLRSEMEKLIQLERELQYLEETQARELQQRALLRDNAARLSDRLYERRLEQVRQINSERSSDVVLALRQGEASDHFAQQISALLKRSSIRNQDDVASDLARELSAAGLIDIVEQRDASKLALLLDRDIGQMTRLVAHLADTPSIYALESTIPEDVLEITMFVQGEARPIHQLSKGQMATALLPLILREAPYPLVFDQPEDDLDNAYISQQLVDRIRSLKAKRQVIFVTHNANIPVLGDADTVVVMEMESATKARIAAAGSVDDVKQHVITLLEGGKEAFNRRQERYGQALR